MAPERSIDHKGKKSGGKESSRAKASRHRTLSDVGASAAKKHAPLPSPTNAIDLTELLSARLRVYDKPGVERRKRMPYVGEVVRQVPATKEDVEIVKRISAHKRQSKATRTVRTHSHDRQNTKDKHKAHEREPKDNYDGESEDEEEEEYGSVDLGGKETERNDSKPSRTLVSSTIADDGAEIARRSTVRRDLSSKTSRNREEPPRRPQRRQSDSPRRRNSYGVDPCAPVQR